MRWYSNIEGELWYYSALQKICRGKAYTCKYPDYSQLLYLVTSLYWLICVHISENKFKKQILNFTFSHFLDSDLFTAVAYWKRLSLLPRLSGLTVGCHRKIQIQIQNNFIVSKYTRSIIHKYTKRLYQQIHRKFSEYIQCYGSKGSWTSCWIYGLLVWYTKISFITTGVQGCRGCNNDNTARQ